MDPLSPSDKTVEAVVSRGESSFSDAVVKIADPTVKAEWDEWLARIPDSTFFHGAAWLSVLRETYGFVPHYLTLTQRGETKAVMPLFEAHSWFSGRRGVSLPFTDECGPIGSEPEHIALLVKSAVTEGELRRWRFLEIRGSQNAGGIGPELQSCVGHRLRLNVPACELFKGFTDSVRRAIKKGERAGLEVEQSGSLEATRIFYALHCRTRRRHGLPPQPFQFFINIHRFVFERDLGFVSVAKKAGRPVAAAIFMRFGKKAIYKFGASDERLQHLRGNNVVMWTAIQHLLRRGCEELVFGRTSVDEQGLRRFKLGWAADEYPISYRRYDYSEKRFIPVMNRAVGFHNHLFRCLPLPLLRFMGARLYPHLV